VISLPPPTDFLQSLFKPLKSADLGLHCQCHGWASTKDTASCDGTSGISKSESNEQDRGPANGITVLSFEIFLDVFLKVFLDGSGDIGPVSYLTI
jgi:hypothetical protein